MRYLLKTEVLKVNPARADKKSISRAARILRGGGLVAFPTETVYGLGANLLNKRAIDRLYRVKNRPKAKPFTVHISDLKMVERLGCHMSKKAEALVGRFWPGPLTIILKSKGGRKIGFRMPDNKVALELIKRSGCPVAAPSANLSGRKPPKSAEEVLRDLDGRIDLLLDAGRTRVGIESTVMDLTSRPPKVLREGAIKSRVLLEATS